MGSDINTTIVHVLILFLWAINVREAQPQNHAAVHLKLFSKKNNQAVASVLKEQWPICLWLTAYAAMDSCTSIANCIKTISQLSRAMPSDHKHYNNNLLVSL